MTDAEIVVPAFIRGRLVEDDLVLFDGRGSTATFRAPNPQTIVSELPLSDPGLLADVQALPFAEIVNFLDTAGDRLVLEDNPHLQLALQHSVGWSDMTGPLVEAAFRQIRDIFRADLVREIADMGIGIPHLEGWVEQQLSDGRRAAIRAVGARAVHIVAGNSPMVSALTILRNAFTRSDAIIKSPSNDPMTALAIARTFAEMAPDHPLTKHLSVAYWRGGDADIEAQLFHPSAIEKIVAWGGFASVTHVAKYVQPGVELVTLDPKRSASVIGSEAFESAEALQEAAIRAATDVGALNQLGCVNARIIYVISGTDREGLARARDLGERIYREIQRLPQMVSTAAKRFDPELRANIDGIRTAAEWYHVIGGHDGEGAIIVSQFNAPVDFHRSLSGRVANIVPIDSIHEAIAEMNAYTQTVGVYPDPLKSRLRDELALHGPQRLISLGYAAHNHIGLPQDAIEPIRRMVKWIVDETCEPPKVAPLWAAGAQAGGEPR